MYVILFCKLLIFQSCDSVITKWYMIRYRLRARADVTVTRIEEIPGRTLKDLSNALGYVPTMAQSCDSSSKI